MCWEHQMYRIRARKGAEFPLLLPIRKGFKSWQRIKGVTKSLEKSSQLCYSGLLIYFNADK